MRTSPKCRPGTNRRSHAAARAFLSALVATAGLTGLAAPGRAHEFWIETVPVAPRIGDEITVRFFLGAGFPGEELPYRRARTLELRHIWPEGTRELQGEDGAAPAAWFDGSSAGVHLVAYRSAPSHIVLPPETFNTYLAEEGLEGPLAARRQNGDLDAPGRERYARYAKSALVIGTTDADAHAVVPESVAPVEALRPGQPSAAQTSALFWSVPLGHRIELVLETDPAEVRLRGGEITARLLYEDRPLAHHAVFAFPPVGVGELRREETDDAGRVRFVLNRAGLWMIAAVHMVPRSGDPLADWDSSWASLTLVSGSTKETASHALRARGTGADAEPSIPPERREQ
jgi:hypothetical protein